MAHEKDNHVVGESRTQFGKGFARRLRAAGKIPAVIYGHGAPVRHVALPAHQIGLIIRKKNAVIELTVDGKEELVLVKDVQKDPVHQIIEHMDLVEVRKGEKVLVDVPLHVVGTQQSGAVLELDVKSIAVEAEATHIPEYLEVSVDGAEPGFKITIGEVALPEGVTLTGDPEGVVVHVHSPSAQDMAETEGELAAELADDAAHADHKDEMHQNQHDSEKAAAAADADLSGATAEAEKSVE
ncbi:MAG: 50S ribosomal protein L25/general stress protein Ctc [Actinobacteria bacterium]|uniref:Unannotated protein n=1 Tax=freshwater metagenome TaxID=449393 RepID=A0A6J7F326_9ZZZZ|nr:50S ribosomal protein L25/general stress protein Ctc [Actinomycetota bacterium]